MLTITNLHKAYGAQVLFDDASLFLGANERLGLVGRNGHGKSTLLKIILGQESYDDGSIDLPTDIRVGHLQQHLSFSAESALQEVCNSLPENDLGFQEDYKAERILSGLGFSEDEFLKSPNELSGGYQIRIQLAKLLVSEPDILLLDEPTNYLDILSIRWLENFLISWPRAAIIVTHDRRFMDTVTTHTAMIHRSKIRKVEGNTEKIYQLIADEEDVYTRTLENQKKKREETLKFVERFRAKASKAKQAQSRLKQIAREGELKELEELTDLDFRFPASEFNGKLLFQAKGVGFAYPQGQMLFEDLDLEVGPRDRIAVIGQNGKGKSTLLSLLAGELKPLKGEINFHSACVVGYYGQTNIDRLKSSLTIEEELLSVIPEKNRTRARAIAGAMMFSGDLALKKIDVLSGGERARVLLGKLLGAHTNLLLLDEPTNHLDMESVDSLIEAIERYQGTVIFVSHDEELIERLANRLIVFDQGKARLYNESYEEFLDKEGWSGEEFIAKKPGKSGGGTNKKEFRKKRSQLIAEKSQALKPLERDIGRTEKRIMKIESILEDSNVKLLEITKDGYGDEAVKLSRDISLYQKEIQDLFEELEQQEKLKQEKSAEYEARLAELLGEGDG